MITDNPVREQLLQAFSAGTPTISISGIAIKNYWRIRDAVAFANLAGLKPVFRSATGEGFYFESDIPQIQAAAAAHGPLTWKSVDPSEELPPAPADLNALIDKAGKMAQGIYE